MTFRLGLGLGLRLCVGLGLAGRPRNGRVYLYSGHSGRARGTRKPAVKPSDGEPTRGCCAEHRAPVPLHLDISCQGAAQPAEKLPLYLTCSHYLNEYAYLTMVYSSATLSASAATLSASSCQEALQRTVPGVDDLKLPLRIPYILILFGPSVQERELENHPHYVRVQVSPP